MKNSHISYSPMHLFLDAVNRNDIKSLEDCLKDINFENKWMESLDWQSIIKNSPEVACLLVEKGINKINEHIFEGPIYSKMPLAYAMDYAMDKEGYNKLINALLARSDLKVDDVFIPAKGQPETTLLMYTYNKSVEIFKILLKREDLKLDSIVINNNNILNCVIKDKNVEIVKDILNHKNFESSLMSIISLFDTIKECPPIATLLINKGITVNKLYQENSQWIRPLSYALENNLKEVAEALLARSNFNMSHDEVEGIINFCKQYPQIELPINVAKQLLVVAPNLTNVVSMLQDINFNWSTQFSKNETILHVILSRSDGNRTFKILDYLLKESNKSKEHFININQRDDKGNRAIDLIESTIKPHLCTKFLNLFREYGSVEPKNGLIVEKIIIKDNKAPDEDKDNKTNALKILNLMLNKYKLTDEAIDELITNFKQHNNLSSVEAKWSPLPQPGAILTSETIDNVLKVVDELSTMLDVYDRLPVHWNFKKVLGILIHITNKNDDTSSLIYTLSQIEMCNLSKLMYLLHVVQDELIEVKGIDYTKIGLKDFEHILSLVLEDAESVFEKKAPLALINWRNDHHYNKPVKDPEQWCGHTQKIQGIINKVFAENFDGVDGLSYHFEGLKISLIKPLVDIIMNYSQLNGGDSLIINKWKNIIGEGAALLASKFFDKIVAGEKSVDSLKSGLNDYPLSFGDLSSLSAKSIHNCYEMIKQKIGNEQAKQFISLLSEYTLNSEAEKYCSTQSLMIIDNNQYVHMEEASSNGDIIIELQGDIPQNG